MSTTNTSSSNMSPSNNDNVSKKSKKRKRRRASPEEQFKEEQVERYNKLLYMARKALHKEAKVVKSFEVQKLIRKLKQQTFNNTVKEEETLARVKQFSLDTVVQDVCLQRLGLYNLNPQPNNSNEQQHSNSSKDVNDQDLALVERILRHKRMVTAMKSWNEKVTDYRRWLLSRKERISQHAMPDFQQQQQQRGNNKKKKSKHDGSDLFVCLGGTAAMQEEQPSDEVVHYYGPQGSTLYHHQERPMKRNNRPGQRARKAKAMAIQAKKEGRTWDSSINWREKKKKTTNEEDGKDGNNKKPHSATKQVAPQKASEIATMGTTWKEEGKEHPSWAASQSQKAGIVAFKGKKITFD